MVFDLFSLKIFLNTPQKHENRNFLKNKIENQKILINKMCLEFNFTYAVQISLESVHK